MVQLKVKNFGPVKSGFEGNDGYFEINKFTFFIGDQGTGKSTVAKIFSTFSWLEKAFAREYYDELSFSDFVDLCSYQRLPVEYFKSETELSYKGLAFEFSIKKEKFEFKKNNNNNKYVCPKIVYIPSERNTVSVLEDLEQIKRLPKIIKDFKSELKKANLNLEKYKRNFILNYEILYDKANDMNYIKSKDDDEKIPLIFASSGMQSIVPLMLVTDNLVQFLKLPILEKINYMSAADQEHILNNIDDSYLMSKLKLFLSSNIDKNFTEADIEKLSWNFSSFVDSTFVNIVEEPELNLFPTTQVKILESLIKHNSFQDSKLVITTHSPYILSAMNNYIYAEEVFSTKRKCLEEVSKDLFVNIDDVCAYKLEHGRIINIKDTECNLIDSSAIDDCSSVINDVYSKLMDLGE